MVKNLKLLGLHLLRVADVMLDFATHLDLSTSDCRVAFIAGLHHDLGKLNIDDNILNKPSRLTPEEMNIVKEHVSFSVIQSQNIGRKALTAVIEHHENYSGDGYPFCLKGNEISLHGRILRIVDVYDALRTERSYKTSLNHVEAIETMDREIQYYDPYLYIQFKTFINLYHFRYYTPAIISGLSECEHYYTNDKSFEHAV